MAKTTSINIRLEPGLKEEAEAILDQLGIPVSNAINIFLKQVVMRKGLPFDVKLPIEKPIGMASLTEEQLDAELEKGYQDILEGRTKTAEEVFAELHRKYGI